VTGNTERLNTALAGRYKIEKQLGQGGMATVYLAQDLKHDRKVAVKVLKPELAAVLGAERFVVEIKTTAALQHPHILPLFDSGTADGFLYYVMPYIEGETLRGKLNRETQFSVDEAVRITAQVADALDYAHRHGVIHRDIKPENILLHDGRPMVADFGIALAVSAAAGGRMTETGLSLGTPHYMSPEQATAEKEITGRSDIYSLASVLYEMLTGNPPHTGASAQQIIMKIVTDTARPVTELRKSVPPNVAAAVARALEKLPADRFETAKAFADALSNPSFTTAGRGAGSPKLAAVGVDLRVAAGLLVIVGIAAAAGWRLGTRRATPDAPPSRLAIIAQGSDLGFSGVARTIDISADGKMIAFAGVDAAGKWLAVTRGLDQNEPMPVPNSTGVGQIKLSPDGRFLYGSQSGSVMSRISLAGGTWTQLPGVDATPFLVFNTDGALWWSNALSNAIHRVGPDGRDSVAGSGIIQQFLPGGRSALTIEVGTAANSGTVTLLDVKTGSKHAIFDTPAVEVRYTRGYLVYVQPDLSMMAVPFDASAGRVTGDAVEIARDVAVSGAGFAQWGVADNGTITYIPGFASELVRVSRDGAARPLVDIKQRYHSPRIAPDGRTVAVDIVRPEGRDVWLLAADAKEFTRTTFQKDGHDPVWALGDRSMYYTAGDSRRLTRFHVLPGSTVPPRVDAPSIDLSYTGALIPGGSTYLSTVPGRTGRGSDIVRVTSGVAKVDTLLGTAADEAYVVPSPDGKWFAYISDQSGRPELYLRSLSGLDVQLQVSLDGASEPVWSRDGRELFYRRPTPNGAELVSAAMQLDAQPKVLGRTKLFDVSGFDTATPHANYDVAPDGRSFVFVRRAGGTHIVVLQNVPEMARRLARGTAAAR